MASWSIGDYALAGAAILGIAATFLFVIGYARRAGFAWTVSHAGRYLMIHHALLGSLFSIILYNRFHPNWPGRELVTAALLIGFSVHSFSAYNLVRETYSNKEARNGTRPGRKETLP